MSYIRTFFYQKLEPSTIDRDSRGTKIEKGLRVAYNYQGSVKVGVIEECTCVWKLFQGKNDGFEWWSCKFTMKILSEEGFISVVKNPNSFIII